MTALEHYARLEAVARYGDSASAGTREVVVSFGERTLVVVGMDDLPIAHWPLATLDVQHQGDGSVEIAPFDGGTERLLLDDPEMIEAIDVVAPRPPPPPVEVPPPKRRWAWMTIFAFAAAVVYFLVVPVVSGRVIDLIPVERENAIGLALQTQFMEGLETGGTRACEEPESHAVLEALVDRVSAAPGAMPEIALIVLDHPSVFALSLPGNHLILFRGMITAADTPEELAGLIAHEVHHLRNRDPMQKILDAASIQETIHHIGGDILGEPVPETALTVLLNQPYPAERETASDAHAEAELGEAEVPVARYGAFLGRIARPASAPPPGPDYTAAHPDLTGRAAQFAQLATTDPGEFTPVLSDRDWLVLQNICSGL